MNSVELLFSHFN